MHNRHGYLSVNWRVNGRMRSACVHRMVLELFIGPRPQGLEGRHLNDDKSNNALSNLSYGTKRDNTEDRKRNGRGPDVLTWEAVREIRALLGTVSQRALARRYGVSQSAIAHVATGRNWRASEDPMRLCPDSGWSL